MRKMNLFSIDSYYSLSDTSLSSQYTMATISHITLRARPLKRGVSMGFIWQANTKEANQNPKRSTGVDRYD